MSDFWDRFIPPDDEFASEPFGDDPFVQMAADYDILGDDYALDTLYAGWFDMDVDSDTRIAARQDFLDFMEWDSAEFDWDQWKEWYEAA